VSRGPREKAVAPRFNVSSLVRLAIKLLWRNWRSGEVKILAGALVLAVAVVTCIAVFTGRLENTLVAQSHQFLGADRVVSSSQPIPPEWTELAQKYSLQSAHTTQFSSMVFGAERMHLASVKAVSAHYPLIGELQISTRAFATEAEHIVTTGAVPAAGEAWVDSRVLPLLGVELGGEIFVGEKSLKLSHVIIDEPDRGSNLTMGGARVMINQADLAATEVVQPGSRIKYQWLLAGKLAALDGFIDELTPRLSVHQRIIDLESSQQNLATTLDKARTFLLLAAMIGVLLAGVAIAIAARRFAERHIDQVALMKSLGASAGKMRGLYGVQLLTLGLVASLLGLLLGFGLQSWIASVLASLLPVSLGAAPWSAYGIGLATGVMCLLGFVVPPLWHLPKIPPIKILRRELSINGVQYYWQALLGLLALVGLISVFSQDLKLTLSVVGALLALLLCSALFASSLFSLGEHFGRRAGSIWRLALAGLKRNRRQNIIQMMVFALAVMLLLTLGSLRTSLIADWQLQLPEGTPNHFLMNITPAAKSPVETLMAERSLRPQPFYPMVRARLTHINAQAPSPALMEQAEALQREVNLSWTQQLSDDNRILSGQWWDKWPVSADVAANAVSNEKTGGLVGGSDKVARVGVSVEQEVASSLGLKLGDLVSFSVGGLPLNAEVASIRSLSWDSMNPNFYFLLSPGALDDFSPTLLTSVYVPAEQKLFINDLLKDWPTLVVIELDRVIAQIQSIVTQVSMGVELMLWLVLLGGFTVMWAAVSASMDERMQETALLRALGCARGRLLGSLWIEFSMLGFLSGVMAVCGTEVLLLSMQKWVLNMPLSLHWDIWLLGVGGSTLVIGSMGVLSCRRVLTTPPGLILREVG